MFMNLPIGLPYSTKFKLYHIEHHKLQGVDGIDTDVPTNWNLFYSIMYLVNCFLQFVKYYFMQ